MIGEKQMANNFTTLISALSEHPELHKVSSNTYQIFDSFNRDYQKKLMEQGTSGEVEFPKAGKISIPYFEMGAINSSHLFGLDELILFAFYEKNSQFYRKVADIGANLGLHTIVMAKLGLDVVSYEPDPIHFEQLEKNLINNSISSKRVFKAAVSNENGTANFTRVLGNTTGSHLSGAKENPYGELEKFDVEVVRFKDIIADVDFAKIDVEGHEANLILSTERHDWEGFDCVLEVGTVKNRQAIFEHCKALEINMFSQKIGWKQAKHVNNLPSSYKEGSLFLSKGAKMPW